VLHLVRRNLLKILVSRIAAEQRGLYHLEPGEQRPADRVKLDVVDLSARLEKLATELERGSALAETWGAFPVAYEDLLRDRDATYAGVFDFLAVAPWTPTEEPLRKINPDSLAELVENFDAVAGALRGTRFEVHVDD
jgi:LPS sulfotransferase NodH